jgi:hypothetical protein
MDSSLASLFRLPDELLLLTLGYVGAAEWKQVRRTCRRLNMLAASLLFKRVYFELCTRGCDSLYNISLDPILSSFVKTLVLRRVGGYRKFPDFDTWALSTHQPGAPDIDLYTARETTYYNNKEIRDQLMPYYKWAAMSREQKEALYHSYNLDREQQQKEVRDITNRLRFRILHSAQTALIHPYRAYASTAEDNAVEQFCEALGTLPKLKALEHEPGFLYDDTWGLQWRDLYFHPYSIIGSTDYEEDEDVEALQLSVVLQSLAWVREGDRRLQEMSMYVGGPAFATPERLQHLWDGDGHELTRTCRLVHRNSAAADAEAYSDFATPEQSKLFWAQQLHLMKHALTCLTHLDYRVSDEDELVGSLDTAAELVFHFLLATSELQN